MEAELTILSTIGDCQTITQRDLAHKTNLSLGAINVLVRKMMEKGLIKIERLTPRTVKYVLTPQGMREKAKKTYEYVRRTYERILLIQQKLDAILESLPENDTVYLCGEENEAYQLLTMLLNEAQTKKRLKIKKIEALNDAEENKTVIVWDMPSPEAARGKKYINILNRLV